jgi:hypothetical protein
MSELGTGHYIRLGDPRDGPLGYFFLAHDDLVPGAGPGNIDPLLAIDDPAGAYETISLSLRCESVILDAVCYRGNSLSECEGAAAPDTTAAIGRGLAIDTNDNARDFLPQVEPSPWAANHTEVR